jgi:hypothetical protein
MTPQRRLSVRGLTALGFVLLSAWYSGCQAVNTRSSYNPYYEYDGMWCGNYGIDMFGARCATLDALTELQMPVCQEGPLPHGIFLDIQTPEKLEARVIIMPLARDGRGTRICVRVGGFGTHREVCQRLLDEIARHLDVIRDSDGVPIESAPSPAAIPSRHPIAAPPQSQVSEPLLPPQPVPVQQ